MNIESIRQVFAWCIVVDVVLLFWWFGVLVFARDFVYRLHTRWFRIPAERFDAIHYSAMALFKVGMVLFHVAPWIALHAVD